MLNEGNKSLRTTEFSFGCKGKEEEGSKWGREEWKGKRGYKKILKNILGIFESF